MWERLKLESHWMAFEVMQLGGNVKNQDNRKEAAEFILKRRRRGISWHEQAIGSPKGSNSKSLDSGLFLEMTFTM
jgi:hypothetical protein